MRPRKFNISKIVRYKRLVSGYFGLCGSGWAGRGLGTGILLTDSVRDGLRGVGIVPIGVFDIVFRSYRVIGRCVAQERTYRDPGDFQHGILFLSPMGLGAWTQCLESDLFASTKLQ